MSVPPGNVERRTQQKASVAIALTLRYGALASTLVMALGVGLLLIHRLLGRFEPEAVMRAGILLLLLTPVFRIVVAAMEFGLERDFRYLLVSLGVLAVVLVSIGFAVG